jgi:hypothetical protein
VLFFHPGDVRALSSDTPPVSINGFVWEESSPQSKLDFLLGVECAIAMEAALLQADSDYGGRGKLSLFAHGWKTAFQNRSRPDIMQGIDAFYTANPHQKSRHVFDIVWTEMVEPSLRSADTVESQSDSRVMEKKP